MPNSVFAFDVDDCLELGGQVRMPSAFGPVTIQSIRQQVAQGDIAIVVGNWMNLPSVLPDWREVFQYLLPPAISSSPKGFWLAWVRAQYPGYQHYVMVGNDPSSHDTRPAYWDRDWPGSLPVSHVPGQQLLSNDIAAAAEAGWEFIKEDDWAAGMRIGKVPPRKPTQPFYQFPKGVRPPMQYKSFPAEVLKADKAKGLVSAIVSVTGNLDLQGDVIDPGAWKAAIDYASSSGRMPKVTVDHNWSARTQIGQTLDMEELMPGDKRLPDNLKSQGYGGLLVEGRLNLQKQLAQEVFSDLDGGFGNEFSVGFDIDTDADGKSKCEEQDGANHIKSIKPLYEWSAVFMGANELTMPISAKGVDGQDLEQAEFAVLTDSERIQLYYDTLELPEAELPQKARWARAFVAKHPELAKALDPRKHAPQVKGSQSAATHPTTQVTANVHELNLKTLGAAVGANLAKGLKARRQSRKM